MEEQGAQKPKQDKAGLIALIVVLMILAVMAVCKDICINIIAQFLAWALGGAGVSGYIRVTSVRRFREFFGLYKEPSLFIYLSNMALSGDIDRGVALQELWAAQSLHSLFGRTPSRVPEVIRGLVDSFLIPSPTEVVTRISPPETDGNPFPNMIVIGSAKHNTVRAQCLRELKLHFALESKESEFPRQKDFCDRGGQMIGGSHKCKSGAEYYFAILEKTQDEEGHMVFMCVGESADSSWGAVEFLTRNWQRLSKRFGASPFALWLDFSKGGTPMQKYVEPEERCAYARPASE